MERIYVFLGVAAIVVILIVFWILRKKKGSIEIIPEKYSYSSDETINGKLILKLKESIKSESLIVGLRCEQTNKSSTAGKVKSSKYSLFDFNQPVENTKENLPNEYNYNSKKNLPNEYNYNFSIKIPRNVSRQLDGATGSLVKTAQILMGKDTSLKWYLYAELKCEGFNIYKSVQINIV